METGLTAPVWLYLRAARGWRPDTFPPLAPAFTPPRYRPCLHPFLAAPPALHKPSSVHGFTRTFRRSLLLFSHSRSI